MITLATSLEASAVESIDREEGGAPFADFFLQIHHVDRYQRPAHEVHGGVVDTTQQPLEIVSIEAGYLGVYEVLKRAGVWVGGCPDVRLCVCACGVGGRGEGHNTFRPAFFATA